MLTPEVLSKHRSTRVDWRESDLRLAEARQLVAYLGQYPHDPDDGPSACILFGSKAKRKAKPGSDIDIGFIGPIIPTWEDLDDLYRQSSGAVASLRAWVTRALSGAPIKHPLHQVYIPYAVYYWRYPASDFGLKEKLIDEIHRYGIYLFKVVQ